MEKRDFLVTEKFSGRAHFQPVWRSREIYDESFVFIGKEGCACLLYNPEDVLYVRNYRLNKTYKAGIDYVIKGDKIFRLPNSGMDYWEADEYYPKEPSSIPIGITLENIEFNFSEERYIRYAEDTTFTDKQYVITYRHQDKTEEGLIKDKRGMIPTLISKLNERKEIRMMVYGDSVAVGCSASGSSYGGNISPYTPIYSHSIRDYIKKRFRCEVLYDNQAVGGWGIKNCLDSFDEKIGNKPIDFLLLRIGTNDSFMDPYEWEELLIKTLDRFYEKNPGITILLQSTESPNYESTWFKYNGEFEKIMLKMERKYSNLIVAPLYSFSEWAIKRGKKYRDYLANNINHPSDFMLHCYVQVILNTMFGDDYYRYL